MNEPTQYLGQGYLAVAPQALGGMFLMTAPRAPVVSSGSLGIVEFAGPLTHHEGRGPSYDGLKCELRARFESECKAVLVSGDTMGGDTAGAFDTAREIRAMRLHYNKPLLWYVDANACSSGYNLACAADRIYCPSGGFVGSIGVIYALPDETARDAAMGVKWVIIRTGEHKSDGNSHIPMTEAAIAEVAKHCESTGEIFYDWVRERRGIPVETQRAWAGRMFQGAQALALGLVDQIATFDEVVAMVTADLEGNGKALAGGGQSMSKKSEAVAALKAAAEESTDDKEKSRYAKAIAAIEATEPDGDEAEKKKKEEEAKAKAEAESADEAEKKKKDEEAKSKAAASETEGEKKDEGAKALAIASNLATRFDDQDRRALLDGRLDLPPAFRAHCEKLSVPEVRALLAITPLFPKQLSQVEASRAAIGIAPTSTSSGTAPASPEDLELDEMMGIAAALPVIEHTAIGAVFRAATPDRARAAHADYMKSRAAREGSQVPS